MRTITIDYINCLDDVEYETLTCYICNKQLKVGDQYDHYHPYHVEYNRCEGCKEINI